MPDNKRVKDESELTDATGAEMMRGSQSPFDTAFTNFKITYLNFARFIARILLRVSKLTVTDGGLLSLSLLDYNNRNSYIISSDPIATASLIVGNGFYNGQKVEFNFRTTVTTATASGSNWDADTKTDLESIFQTGGTFAIIWSSSDSKWYEISKSGSGGGTVVDASNTVKGITKLSVAAASPTSPIAVGDNDTRVQNVEHTTNKDATGGYVGLTLFKINFKNALNSFTSFLTNSNTAARTYTFQDRDGTIADLTDIPSSLPPSGSAGGELAGTYPNPTLVNSAVLAKLLTGLSVTGSTILSTDTILQAFGKVQSQLNAMVGGVIYKGTYNATTNTPTLVDGTGTQGWYYVVATGGTQNFGSGAIIFNVGDWVIYNGAIWQKVDNTDAVVSVNGYIGAVTLVTSDIAENVNLYFTAARVLATILTGYTSGAGTVSASDTVLQAIQKLNGNIAALTTGVSSVFSRTGAVVATNGDYNSSQVTENTNLYFTNARAIAATLTGYVSGAGTISASDSILQAIQKLNGNDALYLLLTGGSLSGALNEAKGADIASATTTDIGAATGNYLVVTGTTTITGLGTIQAGTRRVVKFSGILTLTYDATALILPTAASIITAAGDTATFISLGSGNWICVQYLRASGSAIGGKGELALTIDGQTAVISTGQKAGYITIPYSGTITGWDIFSTVSGSIVVDIWKLAYASFPPTVANTIFSGNKPTLSSATKNQNTSMSVAVTAGDVFAFNVDSVTTCTLVTVCLKITKS